MISMWFTGINYYKLAVEKDRDSIFTTMWKPGLEPTVRCQFALRYMTMVSTIFHPANRPLSFFLDFFINSVRVKVQTYRTRFDNGTRFLSF
jgi:hypothetical protein